MSSRSVRKSEVIDLNKPFTCEFCKKSFTKEASLVSHMCEPKRRHQSRHMREVTAAYETYVQLQKILNPKKAHVIPTYQEFCHSTLWTTLVKFRTWCEEQLVQECAAYVVWLCDRNVRVDAWCDRMLYDEFLKDLLLSESAEQAVARSLTCMQQWAQHTGQDWRSFFEKAHPNQIIQWITTGRLTAWLVYNTQSAECFLQKCTPEQLQTVQRMWPPQQWRVRFLRQSEEAECIRSTLTQAGL